MSTWIDYDSIDYKHYQLHDKSAEFLNGVVYMAELIEEAPSIDIVRCKECKWYERPELKITLNCCRDMRLVPMKPTDFCSYGERRTDG